MPNTITDVSTFTDPIQYPADGDAVGAAAELNPAQGLANRTKYLKDIVDARGDFGIYSIADGAGSTLSAITAGGYTLTSNAIEVPSAGSYVVQWQGFVTTTGTSAGDEVEVAMAKGGSAQASAIGVRATASAAELVFCSGQYVVSVTTPASERISFYLGASAGTPAHATATGGSSPTNTSIVNIWKIA